MATKLLNPVPVRMLPDLHDRLVEWRHELRERSMNGFLIRIITEELDRLDAAKEGTR